MKLLLSTFALLFATLGYVVADEEKSEDEPAIDVNALGQSKEVSIKAGIDASGAFVGGWRTFDIPNPPFDPSLYFLFKTNLKIDARPSSDFRMYGSFAGEVPNKDGISWSNLSVDELFMDLTLLDTVFFRVGKQSLSIGMSKNLLESQTDGIIAKASVPVFGANLMGSVIARQAYFAGTEYNMSKLGYAASFEGSVGDFSLGTAGFYQADATPSIDFYLQTVVSGIDTKLSTALQFLPGGRVAPLSRAAFFWEGLEPKLRVEASYTYNAATQMGVDQEIALKAGLVSIPGTSLKLGASWEHSFLDSSGRVQLGFSIVPVEHVLLTCGLPFYYGKLGSTFDIRNSDPNKRLLSFLIKVDFSGQFEAIIPL